VAGIERYLALTPEGKVGQRLLVEEDCAIVPTNGVDVEC